jgi:futalosine hydrolase
MAYALLCHEFGNQKIRVFKGPFITVSTITATDSRAHMLCTAFNPVMESMEGSSAAQVAMHYGIPFLEIRSASNRVGKRDRSSWDLPLAFRNNARAVIHLVNNIRLDVTKEKSTP